MDVITRLSYLQGGGHKPLSELSATDHTHSLYLTLHLSLANYALKTDIPTSLPASDVYAWAKAATKPSYTYSEVGAAAASHTHNYLPLSGGTLSGLLKVNALIFGYMYGTSGNRAAFMWDKPGSYYTGVGANGSISTILFSACDANGNWVDFKQYWIFKGDVTASGAFYTNSDIRYKDIQSYINPSIEDISKCSIFDYKWNDDKHDDEVHTGMSAQDVEQILPNLVTENETGFKSLNYANLGAIEGVLCAREIVKLKEEIKQLKEYIHNHIH